MSGLGVRGVHVPGAAWKVPVSAKIGGTPPAQVAKTPGKGPFKHPPAMPPAKGPGKPGRVPSPKPVKPGKPVSGPTRKGGK